MPESRRMLSNFPGARAALRCGWLTNQGHCALDRPLSGAALASLLLFLAREELVRVDWVNCSGSVDESTSIGTITERGREVYERGWL